MHRGGGAWLTATRDGLATRLTRVSHRTPTRLLPLTDTACRLGAAHCAIGGYGGGLLGGDTVHLDVRVDAGARLCLTTQASTKIYCTKRDGRVTRQTLSASVGPGGLLVLAPDPVVPYAHAAHDQRQTFELAPGSSLVAVDWVAAGRVSRGERWAFTTFSSRNTVHRLNADGAARSAAHHRVSSGSSPQPPLSPTPEPPLTPPVVTDAVRLVGGVDGPIRLGFELNGRSFNAAVTVLCTGSAAAGVCRRLRLASAALAARRVGGRPGVLKENTAVREENSAGREGNARGSSEAHGSEAALAAATMRTLLGDAVLGVGTASAGGGSGGWSGAKGGSIGVSRSGAPNLGTGAPDLGTDASNLGTGAPNLSSGAPDIGAHAPTTGIRGDEDVTVARLVAEHSDDVFRLLHFCLGPLAPELGIAPYAGRIHAVNSAAAPRARAAEAAGAREATVEPARKSGGMEAGSGSVSPSLARERALPAAALPRVQPAEAPKATVESLGKHSGVEAGVSMPPSLSGEAQRALPAAALPRVQPAEAPKATVESLGKHSGVEAKLSMPPSLSGEAQRALPAAALPRVQALAPLTPFPPPAPAVASPLSARFPFPPLTPAQRVRLIQLCDATLPTGGFAHSGSLEAAAQLGLLGAEDEEDLRQFTAAAAASASGMLAPYAAAACEVFYTEGGLNARVAFEGGRGGVGERSRARAGGGEVVGGGVTGGGEVAEGIAGGGIAEVAGADAVRQLREWASLDAQLHSQLAGNEPACRASVEQGRALVRVAGAWLHKVPAQRRLCASLLSHGRPHGATTLGALCAMLRLTPEAAAEAVAYTATRDVLSAAVRLNLIGPLAAVGMQADVAETAVGSALAAAALGVSHAASVAPLIEALHPCHDLLDRRIFRT